MTPAGPLADPAQVRAHLIEAAGAGRPITYSDLLDALGHRFTRPKMRALCKVLAPIDEEAAQLGEPELAVLVVRQSDGLPGQGWWVGDAAMVHGYDGLWQGPEAARFISACRRQAFDYWASRHCEAASVKRLPVTNDRTFTVGDGRRRHSPGPLVQAQPARHQLQHRLALGAHRPAPDRRQARATRRPDRGRADHPHPAVRSAAGAELAAPAAARPADPRGSRNSCARWSSSRLQHAFVLNKPPGLATQGGTKTHDHLDRLLGGLEDDEGNRPKLVHRLDKDTSGRLLVARSARAAAFFSKSFAGRTAKKVYWALVVGVPPGEEGEIDLPLAKQPGTGGEKMHVDRENGLAARTRWRMIDRAGNRASWLELQPLTGRTHQLRAHLAAIGFPIVGDGKYGGIDAHLTGGISRKLHLHARRLKIDAPDKGMIDVTAELPDHFEQSLEMLGFSRLAGDMMPLDRPDPAPHPKPSNAASPLPPRPAGKRTPRRTASPRQLRGQGQAKAEAEAQDDPSSRFSIATARWSTAARPSITRLPKPSTSTARASAAKRMPPSNRSEPGRGDGGAASRCRRRRPSSSLAEIYQYCFISARAEGRVEEPLFDGILELLDALEADGWQLAVATGKSDRGLRHCLNSHGLHARFVSLQTATATRPSRTRRWRLRRWPRPARTLHSTIVIGDTAFDMGMARGRGRSRRSALPGAIMTPTN